MYYSHAVQYKTKFSSVCFPYTVTPGFKPQGVINFKIDYHPGSNQEWGEIETLKNLNFSIWTGKLTWVQFKTGFNSRPRLYLMKYSTSLVRETMGKVIIENISKKTSKKLGLNHNLAYRFRCLLVTNVLMESHYIY